MPTQVLDLGTSLHAVRSIDAVLGPARNWVGGNTDQRSFIRLLDRFGAELVKRLQDIKTKVSSSAAVLNAFLVENNFDPCVQPFNEGRKDFGVVTIIDRWMKWLESMLASDTIIKLEKEYPAFKLLGPGVEFFDMSGRVVVCLQTQLGDQMWLTPAKSEIEGMELFEHLYSLSTARRVRMHDYEGVVIPEVMINVKPSLAFLLGMSTSNEAGLSWQISQAYQQAKFAMNKEGARLKVATAIGMKMTSIVRPKMPFVFDTPFYLWMMGREGIELPLGSMYVDKDVWKKADLNAL